MSFEESHIYLSDSFLKSFNVSECLAGKGHIRVQTSVRSGGLCDPGQVTEPF